MRTTKNVLGGAELLLSSAAQKEPSYRLFPEHLVQRSVLLPPQPTDRQLPPCLPTMFKPSQPMLARLRLTTKQVLGGYYKGNRTGSMGYFAKNGSYVIDWKKVRTFVVPENLDQFKVGFYLWFSIDFYFGIERLIRICMI